MGANICLAISRPIFANNALSTKPRVDTLQQNGVAEQKNWHLLEVTRSLMFDTHVPKSYWGTPCSLLHISSIGCLLGYKISKHPSRCCPHLSLLQKVFLQKFFVVFALSIFMVLLEVSYDAGQLTWIYPTRMI
jgi:hypothetical protein